MSDSTNQSFLEKYMTPIAVLIGAIVIAVALTMGRGDVANQGANQGEQIAVDIKDVKTEGSPSIGSPTAPVVMAIWYDYQCPFCKQFELTTMSELFTQYVETGKLRVIFKDFQFLGPDSDTAALFARAVWDAYPDQFYTWYIKMAESQDEEHGGFGDLESIKAMTATIPGIDVARVEALMNEKKSEYQAAITADRAEGASFGIQGTPSMIIGTTLLSGAQPTAAVASLIDAELAK